jgi:hypothetical protein
VAEQFLDRSKIRATFEQMRRKRVAQSVRVRIGERRCAASREPRPGPQPPSHVGRAQTPSGLGQEQRPLATIIGCIKRRPAPGEVALERRQSLLADRH